MPWAAKQPCRGGCGVLVESGYCDGCKAKGKGRDHRPSAAKRLYDERWRNARKAYLELHPLCVGYPAGAHDEVVVAAGHVDHIVPHRGDLTLFWDQSNWQSLCHSCHSKKTAAENGAFGRRYAWTSAR